MLIATNTMHKVYPQIQQALKIPVLHIADATAVKISQAGLSRLGLLGTIYTMQQDFYKGRLEQRFGLQIMVPEVEDQKMVNQVIFEELVVGRFEEQSRINFQNVIQRLIARGAEGVILGCTEIPLIVNQDLYEVPLFDTTYLHAEMAVEIALGERRLDTSMDID
jgi:aspartate racemase